MRDDFTIRRLVWLELVALEPGITCLARRLAMILALRFVNRQNYGRHGVLEAWPSQATLSELTGATRDGVRKAFASLVRAGLLTIHAARGRRTHNIYRLVLGVPEPRAARPRRSASSEADFRTENSPTGVCMTPLKEPKEDSASPSLAHETRSAKRSTSSAPMEVGWDVHHARHGLGKVVAVLLDDRYPTVPYIDVEFQSGVERLLSSVVTQRCSRR